MPEIGAEEQADSPDAEEVAIIMEIAEVIKRVRKDWLLDLRNVPKKKLLEQTAKVDKVLTKLKTYSITKTNELFYAGAAVVTNRLGVKVENARENARAFFAKIKMFIGNLPHRFCQVIIVVASDNFCNLLIIKFCSFKFEKSLTIPLFLCLICL